MLFSSQGGPIALVKDGDKIVIDSDRRVIDWDVDEEEKARRRKEWEGTDKGQLIVKRGILYKYARDVAVSISPYPFSRCILTNSYRSRPVWALTPIEGSTY